MLTQTSELAIRILVYLIVNKPDRPLAPHVFARAFDASPSYTAKITGMLVKTGILAAHRGVRGGVTLNRSVDDVSLLEIIEVCQGKFLADYCQEFPDMGKVCAFHRVMKDVHGAIVKVLDNFSLADLAKQPLPAEGVALPIPCKMTGVCECGSAGKKKDETNTREEAS